MDPRPHAAANDQPQPTTAAEPITRLLTDFTATTPDLGWYVVNDGVMGGRSEGDFARAGEALAFKGTTNTDGGGFSSIRTRGLELDLAGFDGIRVRVRGDGRRYTWRLTTDARWRGRQAGFWADFETKKDSWVDVEIPFTRFKAQWRGRPLPDIALDPATIRGMGLMIYDKRDGPFALRLDRVEAYRAPFALADLRWTRRVLVAHAPSADDERLRALRDAIAATHEDFADRDLLLIVVLGTGEARAGDVRLAPEEALTVLEAARIEPGGFALRLIGKDGTVKRSASAFSGIEEYYDLIDTMPMRRAEQGR